MDEWSIKINRDFVFKKSAVINQTIKIQISNIQIEMKCVEFKKATQHP